MHGSPRCSLKLQDFWLVILAELKINSNLGTNGDIANVCAIGYLGKQKIRKAGYFLRYFHSVEFQRIVHFMGGVVAGEGC